MDWMESFLSLFYAIPVFQFTEWTNSNILKTEINHLQRFVIDGFLTFMHSKCQPHAVYKLSIGYCGKQYVDHHGSFRWMLAMQGIERCHLAICRPMDGFTYTQSFYSWNYVIKFGRNKIISLAGVKCPAKTFVRTLCMRCICNRHAMWVNFAMKNSGYYYSRINNDHCCHYWGLTEWRMCILYHIRPQ